MSIYIVFMQANTHIGVLNVCREAEYTTDHVGDNEICYLPTLAKFWFFLV